jgi:hypothetical protein
MKIIVLLLLISFVFSQDNAPFIRGVPGDQSSCAISDGTYLYQGSNTDPGKIIKVRMSDLQRMDEYINDQITFLCPGTFDTNNQFMYFAGRKNGANGAAVLLKLSAALDNPTVFAFDSSVDFFRNMFSDANYIYLAYTTTTGASEVMRIKISDNTVDGKATVSSGSTNFVGLIPDSSSASDKVAVFTGSNIIRFSLKTFAVIDTRNYPAGLSYVQASAVSDRFLFFGNGSKVIRYDIATLSAQGSFSFYSNIVRFLKVDPFNNNLLHIDYRFPGVGPRDPTAYPYQYIRASVDPFSLIDSSAYSISATQINDPNFLTAFKGDQYFQYIGNLDPKPYALPILVKISLDSNVKESAASQQQGSEFLGRADFAQGSIIMASSASLMKRSVSDLSYAYVALPAGMTFQYGFREAAVISSNGQFGYYVVNNGVAKFKLSDLSLAESKVVSFGNGYWTDAAVQSGDNIYFYFVQTSDNGASIIRYEYNSGAASDAVALTSNGVSFNLIYDTAVDSSGNYLYCGAQSGADGRLWIFRYSFLTKSVDMATQLTDVYYIPAVEIDRNNKYLVVTTNGDTLKVKTSDLSITSTLSGPEPYRLSGIVFDKDNTNVYLSGATSGSSTLGTFEVDFASFTVKRSFTSDRAQGGRAAYDANFGNVYLVGSESFVFGSNTQPSNIAVISNGAVTTTGGPNSSSDESSSSSAPSSTDQSSSSSAPPSSTKAPPSIPANCWTCPSGMAHREQPEDICACFVEDGSSVITPAPSASTQASDGENLSGDNNARSLASKTFAVFGIVIAAVISVALSEIIW